MTSTLENQEKNSTETGVVWGRKEFMDRSKKGRAKTETVQVVGSRGKKGRTLFCREEGVGSGFTMESRKHGLKNRKRTNLGSR